MYKTELTAFDRLSSVWLQIVRKYLYSSQMWHLWEGLGDFHDESVIELRPRKWHWVRFDRWHRRLHERRKSVNVSKRWIMQER